MLISPLTCPRPPQHLAIPCNFPPPPTQSTQVTLVAKVVGAAERGTYLDVAVDDGSGAIDVSIFLEQDDVSNRGVLGVLGFRGWLL